MLSGHWGTAPETSKASSLLFSLRLRGMGIATSIPPSFRRVVDKFNVFTLYYPFKHLTRSNIQSVTSQSTCQLKPTKGSGAEVEVTIVLMAMGYVRSQAIMQEQPVMFLYMKGCDKLPVMCRVIRDTIVCERCGKLFNDGTHTICEQCKCIWCNACIEVFPAKKMKQLCTLMSSRLKTTLSYLKEGHPICAHCFVDQSIDAKNTSASGESLIRCSDCDFAHYCSDACRNADRITHANECIEIQKHCSLPITADDVPTCALTLTAPAAAKTDK
jgi:hypothetical protein